MLRRRTSARRARGIERRLRVLSGGVGGAAAATLLCITAAFAFFAATDSSNGHTAEATAGSIGGGQQPALGSVSGRDVTINWTAASNAATYAVARANVSPQSLSTTEHGSCASSVSGTQCTDTGLLENGTSGTNWTYTNTPQLDNWTGSTSAASATISVPAPALSLVSSSFTADGGSTNATVSNFFDSEGVTYCLDQNTTPCSTQLGTGTVPSSGGTVANAITIPAGTAIGAHTVYAVGSLGSVPSASISVTFGVAKQIALSGSTTNLASGATRVLTATIEDAEGNTITSGSDSTDSVTFSQTGGAGSVSGLGSSNASSGAATDTVTGALAGSLSLRAGATLNGTPATSNTLSFTVIPVVSSVSPNGGPAGGGTSVTVNGIGFTGATSVKFGNTAAASFSVNSSTKITASSSAGSLGAVDVTVSVGTATSAATSADTFHYEGVPTVASISPSSGGQAGGTTVTVTGTNFYGATSVTFGSGNPGTSLSVDSTGTSITISSPAEAAGTVDVEVTTPVATSATSGADIYTYTTLPAPTVTSISPTSGVQAGGTSVTITGTNFTSTSTVKFGANSATVTVNSATQITASSPAASASTVDVTVTNATGTSATSSADIYTYTTLPAPTVTSINPSSGPAAGGTSVTITGANFTAGSTVKFGTNSAIVIVNGATSITATAPAHAAGTVDVTVTNATGTSATSGADIYTYTNLPAPTVTSISPNSGPAAGGTSVIITGTNFTSTSTVKFGATSATVTVNSATQITASSPAGSAGTVDVTVTNATGTSATSSADIYTYTTLPGPTVTSISPNSGPAAGGTSVTITGTNFTSTSTVKFGATSATVTVNSATQITASSPAGSAGTVDVTVTVGSNTSATSSNDKFTYVGTPTQLVFTTQPGGGTGGTTWSTQPVVAIEDALGNTVTTDTNPVQLAISTNPSSGTLACTTNPVAAVNGAATFAGCKIGASGTGYKLIAFDTTDGIQSIESSAFNITLGSATQIGFLQQPSGATAAAAAFPIQPKIAIEDAGGNTVTGASATVTLTLQTGAGTLGGCTAGVATSSGVATFSGCTMSAVGNGDVLKATATGGFSGTVNSAAFNITGTASKLAFTTQPGNQSAGVFSTQPAVSIEDASGNLVTANATSVTLAINAGGGTLTCKTNALAASYGIAQFTNCGISATGSNDSLKATDGSLTLATSNAFNVTAITSPTVTYPAVANPVNPGHGGTTTFVLMGTAFVNGATVTGTGSATVNSVSWASANAIVVTVTGSGGNGASGAFTVTNPDGGTVTSANGSFTNG